MHTIESLKEDAGIITTKTAMHRAAYFIELRLQSAECQCGRTTKRAEKRDGRADGISG